MEDELKQQRYVTEHVRAGAAAAALELSEQRQIAESAVADLRKTMQEKEVVVREWFACDICGCVV